MARDDTPAFAAVRDALDRRAVKELKKLLALLPASEKPTRGGSPTVAPPASSSVPTPPSPPSLPQTSG